MFFIASKVLWLLGSPLHLLLFCLGLGLIRARHPLGRRLAWASFALLVVIGFAPVGALLLRPLEDRFPPPPASMAPPQGIIVLGGAIDEIISTTRGQPSLNESAERITAAVALARRYPQAKLVYSGGSAALIHHEAKEAQFARQLWRDLGVPDERMIIEDQSRNTYEDALFTQKIIPVDAGGTWILITSAFHMPRAIGVFRALGMKPIPYPVDYQTTGTSADFRPQTDAARAWLNFEIGAREWIGLAAYRLARKTRTIFPAP